MNASDELLQMTLTSFLFGSALSMMTSGPLSDVIGRKYVVIYSLSIFLIATIIAATTDSMIVLIIARFFQALGGSCGTLIGRVMVKESYPLQEQIKILAHLSFAMALCPLTIPLLGGLLEYFFNWRAAFVVLGLVGLCLLVVYTRHITDTNQTKISFSFKELLQHYRTLLTHRSFLAYSLAIGCAWCNYCAFTLESPFLLQHILGYNSISYGILMAIPVIGYLSGISLARKYANDIGWDKLIFIATFICMLGSVTLMILTYLFTINWPIIIFPILVVMIGVGIIIPCTQGAVTQPFPHIAGTASGLFFFIQMLMGGLCGLLLQYTTHQSAIPMALIILGSSILLMLSFSLLTQQNVDCFE